VSSFLPFCTAPQRSNYAILPGHFALVLPLLPLLRHTASLRCARPHRHPLERGAPRRVEPDFSDFKELHQACSTVMDRYGNSKRSGSGSPIYALAVDGDCCLSGGRRGTSVRSLLFGKGCPSASWVEPLHMSGRSTRRGLKFASRCEVPS
jgi:hypothetical protein